MDFSFVADDLQKQSAAGRQPQQPATSNSSGRPSIAVPSYREVQQWQQPTQQPQLLFRPSGLQPLQQPAPAPAPASNPQAPADKRPRLGPSLSQPRQQGGLSPAVGYGARPLAPQPAISTLQPLAPPTRPPAAGGVMPVLGPSGHAGSRPPAPSLPLQQPARPATAARPPLVHPQPQAGPGPSSAAAAAVVGANAIIVSRRQQGNPILKHIRNVRWQYGDIVPDYQLGQYTVALFLSLRYHLLHPDYILYRIKELQRAYRLVVLLCQVDVEDVVKPLGAITKTAALNEVTLICSFSAEECARYLETLKSYETKPAAGIQERVEADYVSRLSAALTSVRGVNKTDAYTLGTNFGSLAAIVAGTKEQFAACPGIGPTKVQRLWEAFNEPFRRTLQPSAAAGPQPPSQPAPGASAAAPRAQSTSAPADVAAATAVGSAGGRSTSGPHGGAGAGLAGGARVGGAGPRPSGQQQGVDAADSAGVAGAEVGAAGVAGEGLIGQQAIGAGEGEGGEEAAGLGLDVLSQLQMLDPGDEEFDDSDVEEDTDVS